MEPSWCPHGTISEPPGSLFVPQGSLKEPKSVRRGPQIGCAIAHRQTSSRYECTPVPVYTSSMYIAVPAYTTKPVYTSRARPHTPVDCADNSNYFCVRQCWTPPRLCAPQLPPQPACALRTPNCSLFPLLGVPPRLRGCHISLRAPRASTYHKHMPAHAANTLRAHYEQHTCALNNTRCCNGGGWGGGRYVIYWVGG